MIIMRDSDVTLCEAVRFTRAKLKRKRRGRRVKQRGERRTRQHMMLGI